MSPTPPPLPIKNVDTRHASFQLALSFLLGVAATLGAVKIYQAQSGQPLQTQWSDNYRIDMNRSSAHDLQQLPRISPAMAERIVAARPFESVEDLQRVGGIGPKSLEKIKPHVTLTGAEQAWSAKPIAQEKVDPNTATLEQLQTLPGIGPKMAQRIIDERAKKLFASCDELRRVSGIGPKTLEKLRPFVDVR